MAGYWIKFDTSTPDKPEVWDIASSLEIDPDAVVGKLLRVWAWFDDHTESGNAPSVTKTLLDRKVGVSGFCDAMVDAGWMIEDEGVISIPKFDRHNGKTAKSRCLTAKRVANHKKTGTESNAKGNAPSVTTALPRSDTEEITDTEEEKKEDSKPDSAIAEATPPLRVLDEWNIKRKQSCLMTEKRKASIKTRLRCKQWVSSWQEAIDRCNASGFCNGDNDRGWVADIDWFLKPDSVTRLLEGKYDRKQKANEVPF
jgi:hypothetical protein